MHVEKWESDKGSREDHYFVDETRKVYIFGFNPDLITPETHEKILDLIMEDTDFKKALRIVK